MASTHPPSFPRRWLRSIAAVSIAAASITAATAQSGGLRVRVYDAKDRSPLPGALVVLSHATHNVSATAERAGKEGDVSFPVLRPGGGYILDVSFPGFGKVRLTDIRVKINETSVLSVGLAEEIQEKVVIEAKRDVVDLAKTESSTKFSDAFIQDLPVQGRFYQNVLKLAPGVLDADGDGNPNVHGARARDFKAIVGGVSNVDPLTGGFMNFVNPDSIEEIEIITAGAGVEYGRAQGGFANIVQKQGSNEFEGVGSFLYRSSRLDGNGATNLHGRRLPQFRSLQPAVQVSGPIVRDKLWYILSHEYHDDEIPVNTGSAIAVTKRTQPISSDRITWQVSRKNKLSFQHQYDPITIDNFGVTSTLPEASSQRREIGGPTTTLAWTAPYSPKLLVDSIVAYQDFHTNILPMTSGLANSCVVGYDVAEFAQCFDLNTGLTSGSYFQSWRDRRQRMTVRSQVELYGGRFWGSSHQFKLGFIVENERYYRDLRRRPIANFLVLNRTIESPRPGQNPFDQVGILGATFFVPNHTTSRATGTTWGVWLEDQIRPLNNLSIRVGVRLDKETIDSMGVGPFDPGAESRDFLARRAAGIPGPVAVQQAFTAYEGVTDFVDQLAGSLGITGDFLRTLLQGTTQQSAHWNTRRRPDDINLSNTNVSPFLGASWDPWSNGKTKLAFTVGRHYNHTPLVIPVEELNPRSTTISFDARRLGGQWAVAPISQGARGGINPAVNVTVVDRGLRTPYQDEWTVSFERELTAETLFKATYINRRFRDQFQDIDINHAPGDYGRCVTQLSRDSLPIIPPPDGILDDCIGQAVAIPITGEPGSDDPVGRTATVQRPDGFLDTYVLNPAWGGIYLIGNFNSADYEAVTLEIDRRLYKSWQLNGSYTWSKAFGDGEDYNQILGDDPTTLTDERGFLAYDQRHVVKVNATTLTPWAFRLGGTVVWQSGLPYSILTRQLSQDAVPPQYAGFGVPDEPRVRLLYPTRQRNDERNESSWTFNMKFAKEMNLRGGKNLQLTAEIFNLLNDDTQRIFNRTNGRTSFTREFGRRYQVGARLAF